MLTHTLRCVERCGPQLQVEGQVERGHQPFKQALQLWKRDHPGLGWALGIHEVNGQVMQRVHKSRGFSPRLLLYGQVPRDGMRAALGSLSKKVYDAIHTEYQLSALRTALNDEAPSDDALLAVINRAGPSSTPQIPVDASTPVAAAATAASPPPSTLPSQLVETVRTIAERGGIGAEAIAEMLHLDLEQVKAVLPHDGANPNGQPSADPLDLTDEELSEMALQNILHEVFDTMVNKVASVFCSRWFAEAAPHNVSLLVEVPVAEEVPAEAARGETAVAVEVGESMETDDGDTIYAHQVNLVDDDMVDYGAMDGGAASRQESGQRNEALMINNRHLAPGGNHKDLTAASARFQLAASSVSSEPVLSLTDTSAASHLPRLPDAPALQPATTAPSLAPLPPPVHMGGGSWVPPGAQTQSREWSPEVGPNLAALLAAPREALAVRETMLTRQDMTRASTAVHPPTPPTPAQTAPTAMLPQPASSQAMPPPSQLAPLLMPSPAPHIQVPPNLVPPQSAPPQAWQMDPLLVLGGYDARIELAIDVSPCNAKWQGASVGRAHPAIPFHFELKVEEFAGALSEHPDIFSRDFYACILDTPRFQVVDGYSQGKLMYVCHSLGSKRSQVDFRISAVSRASDALFSCGPNARYMQWDAEEVELARLALRAASTAAEQRTFKGGPFVGGLIPNAALPAHPPAPPRPIQQLQSDVSEEEQAAHRRQEDGLPPMTSPVATHTACACTSGDARGASGGSIARHPPAIDSPGVVPIRAFAFAQQVAQAERMVARNATDGVKIELDVGDLCMLRRPEAADKEKGPTDLPTIAVAVAEVMYTKDGGMSARTGNYHLVCAAGRLGCAVNRVLLEHRPDLTVALFPGLASNLKLFQSHRAQMRVLPSVAQACAACNVGGGGKGVGCCSCKSGRTLCQTSHCSCFKEGRKWCAPSTAQESGCLPCVC